MNAVPSSPRRAIPGLAFLVSALASGWAMVPDARALPPAERWLPANTVAYLTLPDAASARKAWHTQAPGRLWADPAMGPFRAHTEAQLARVLGQPIEQRTGLRPGPLLDLAEGQVTLAWLDVAEPTSRSMDLRHVLLLDSGSQAAALHAWWTNRETAAPASPFPVSGLDFLRVPLPPGAFDALWRHLLPPLDEPGTSTSPASAPDALYLGCRDSVFLASTSTQALTHVLSRLGEPPAPSPSPVLAHGVLMVPAFLRSLSTAPLGLAGLGGPEGGPSMARLASALGLTAIRQASFSVRAGAEGWSSAFQWTVPAAARNGVFGMFALRDAEAAPPPWVPADARDFVRVRISGPAAWAGLEKTLGDMDPAFLGVLRLFAGYAGRTEDADFDFQKGIIDLLGDDWTLASVPTGTPGAFGSLLWIGSPKPQDLLRGLRLVASPTYLATFFPPDGPSPRRTQTDVHGEPVTSIALPPMPWQDGATGSVHFAQGRGYVAISTEIAALAAFLGTNLPPSLASHRTFAEAVLRTHGTTGGYCAYADERIEASSHWNALTRTSQTLADQHAWIALFPTALRLVAGTESWMDPALLPPFEKIAGYFGPRITSGRATSNALEFITFRPTPPPRRP